MECSVSAVAGRAGITVHALLTWKRRGHLKLDRAGDSDPGGTGRPVTIGDASAAVVARMAALCRAGLRPEAASAIAADPAGPQADALRRAIEELS